MTLYVNREHTDGNHPSSAITEQSQHTTKTGHKYSFEDMFVLAREGKAFSRKVREAIAIQKKRPALNRDRGLELMSN